MRFRAAILALMSAVTLSSPLFAQEKPFVTAISNADLTPSQTSALIDLRSLSTTGEVQVIRLDPEALRQNMQVTIPLPGRADVMVAADTRTSTGDSNFAVAGRTESLDSLAAGTGPVGTSTFSVNGDSITGSIQTETGLYRIRPLGGGAHAIFKVGAFPSEHPESFGRPENQNRDLIPFLRNQKDDRSLAELRILVAYTPAVEARVNDIKGLVDLAFLETNNSYESSGVFIRAVPAASDPVLTNYVESGSFEVDLAALKTPADGKMDELLERRDQDSADIVVLFVDNGSYCGLASDILASKESAFALVYHDCATGYYSFAHEIGHLQGARHNPEVDPTNIPFSYGHGFMDISRNRRSIMSYDCPGGCTRLPQWARPTEWGTPDLHHDARVLNETRGFLAGFR